MATEIISHYLIIITAALMSGQHFMLWSKILYSNIRHEQEKSGLKA